MIFNPVIYGASATGLLYIYVAQLPDKRDYYTGENFDPTGMVVKGVNEDLTEIVIPNDQLSYIPPMPLTVESELLRLIYTEGGRSYGTTLALNIMLGVNVEETYIRIDFDFIRPVPMEDEVLVTTDTPISIVVSDSMALVRMENINIVPMEEYAGQSPYDPTPIVPIIVRAIVEFNISTNDYLMNSNNRIVLQPDYYYTSVSGSIDSGTLQVLSIETDDKASVSSIDVSLVR